MTQKINPFNLAVFMQIIGSDPEKKKEFLLKVGKEPEKLEEIMKEMELPPIELLPLKYDYEFYSQKPEIVAQGLVGAGMISAGGNQVAGIITDIDAWPAPVYGKQIKAYCQEPGNIYVYQSTYGKFFAITAHEPQGTGVVRIKQITLPFSEKEISSSKIVSEFCLADMNEKYVNGPDLSIVRMPLDSDYEIRRIEPKAKDKFSVQYKAVKKK